MARRWRIRHKLVLGLATAIAVLGLLLAGTFNGLWSYYVTTKAIESKLEELDAAEMLKVEVAKLNMSELHSSDKRGSLFETDQKPTWKSMVSPERTLDELEKRAHVVHNSLGVVENKFKETLKRELIPDDGITVRQPIDGLREHLSTLLQHCSAGRKSLKNSPNATVVIGKGDRELMLNKEIKKGIQEEIAWLERTSDDLRGAIREGLRTRIDRSREHYQVTLWVVISACMLSLILMVSVLRYFYNWIYNPIRDLQRGVKCVADGSFDHRIEVDSHDEMEELAAAFNDMAYRLNEVYRDLERQVNERSRQLVRSERLASVGFLAAGVAHEINNPLASIAFSSEALEARLDELRTPLTTLGRRDDFDVFAKYLRMIQEEANRCSKITERLLEHSRTGDRKREHVELASLIQSVVDVAQHHQSCRGNEIVFSPIHAVTAWVNYDDVKSVVLNLVVNALESMAAGGRLTIEMGQRDGLSEMSFTDTGCGMSEEVLENVFEPFYTQNRSGKGTGLGLTIAHRIISQHGGEIEATSPGINQGSTFVVRLPMQPADLLREDVGHAA